MDAIIRLLVRFYKNLPFKPFKRLLYKIYKSVIIARYQNRNVVRTIGEISYELDLSEVIDSSLFFQGCFEQDTTRAITKLCKPGFLVIDIGAHTFRFAKLVGSEGKVIAIEPMQEAYNKLKKI